MLGMFANIRKVKKQIAIMPVVEKLPSASSVTKLSEKMLGSSIFGIPFADVLFVRKSIGDCIVPLSHNS